MKLKYILTGIAIILLIMVNSVSAGIFSITDAQAAIAIKPIDNKGISSSTPVAEKDLNTGILQPVKLELSKLGTSESKIIQLLPNANVFVSTNFAGDTTIMQTTTVPGYPLVEVYYGYQKSQRESWQYYFRIEKIDGVRAYVVYGDFANKIIWSGTISRSSYDTIILSGKIPDWMSIRKGG